MKEPIGIIGGGLAGLCLALDLAKRDVPVILWEKKEYPYHKVCGEYLSKETTPYLTELGVNLAHLGAVSVNRLQVTGTNGDYLEAPLQMGAWGISRYTLDAAIAEACKKAGVILKESESVESVDHVSSGFQVKSSRGHTSVSLVAGAWGKRSSLDRKLNRSFFYKRSPYYAVKYHIQTDHPEDLIQLHNFRGGYAGISRVENGLSCLCYLAHSSLLKEHRDVKTVEEKVLKQNPFLKHIFESSTFVWPAPLTINDIRFEAKGTKANGVYLLGDTAGTIVPLCGNGMAMAMHSAALLAPILEAAAKNEQQGPSPYPAIWNNAFGKRLWYGKTIQHLFGNNLMSNLSIKILKHQPRLLRTIIEATHGNAFNRY
jgi:flavin-dependent dehydrogenase